METIYWRDKEHPNGYRNVEEFEHAFKPLCREHLAQGRALAFAFIVFDFDHAEVRKVVQDEDYWDTLDHISGHYLTVFSFHLPSRRKSRLHQPNKPLPDTNQFFERQFGFSLTGSRPRLLFFQVDGKDTEPYFYELWADSVENVFHEIREALNDAVQSLKQFQPENRGNTAGSLNQIKGALMQRKLGRNVRATIKAAASIKDFLPS